MRLAVPGYAVYNGDDEVANVALSRPSWIALSATFNLAGTAAVDSVKRAGFQMSKTMLLSLTRSLVGVFLLLTVVAVNAAPTPDLLRRSLSHDNIEREYFVYLPVAARRGEKLPVVLALHGYTSTATGFAASHGLSVHAEKNGYIGVYPQGSHFVVEQETGAYRVTSWNDLAANLSPTPAGPHCTANRDRYPCPPECGTCNHCAWTSCYDDVGFIGKLLDQVAAEFATDTQRYYLLGVSNGGMMALRLGCNISHRFAAVASIIAQLAPGFECGPGSDLPMLHLVGGKDDTVRIDGKPGGDGFIYATAERTVKTWADALHCERGPICWSNQFSKQGDLLCKAYDTCNASKTEVVGCVHPEGDHEWPGQGIARMPASCVTSEQYASMPGQPHCPSGGGEYTHWGMDLIWEFMKQYSR
ncbi:MAG: alpha/beta hydrolase family esterase [Pseudomonadales bacterium]